MTDQKPITRYTEFFDAVREVVKKRYRFKLFIGPATIPSSDGQGWVETATVYWQSQSTSLWSPISVVAQILYRNPANQKEWIPADWAGKYLGLQDDMTQELINAQYEREGHLPRLREKLLEACELEEIAHSSRLVARRKKVAV